MADWILSVHAPQAPLASSKPLTHCSPQAHPQKHSESLRVSDSPPRSATSQVRRSRSWHQVALMGARTQQRPAKLSEGPATCANRVSPWSRGTQTAIDACETRRAQRRPNAPIFGLFGVPGQHFAARENSIGLIDAVLMRREESKESAPSLCSQPASQPLRTTLAPVTLLPEHLKPSIHSDTHPRVRLCEPMRRRNSTHKKKARTTPEAGQNPHLARGKN